MQQRTTNVHVLGALLAIGMWCLSMVGCLEIDNSNNNIGGCTPERCESSCAARGLVDGSCNDDGICLCTGGDGDGDADGDADGDVDGDGDADDDGAHIEVPVACDPDGFVPCVDDYFSCEVFDEEGGIIHCEGSRPATPDEGDWSCEVEAMTLVCEGEDYPIGEAPYWFCGELHDGTVRCLSLAYQPDISSLPPDMTWDCQYDPDEMNLVCDSSIDAPASATCCIPGSWRFCVSPASRGSWAIQHCTEEGDAWQPCTGLDELPETCGDVDDWFSPDSEARCIDQGLCSQDVWDLDEDNDFSESVGDCTDVICSPPPAS